MVLIVVEPIEDHPVDKLLGLAVLDVIDFELTASVIQNKRLLEVIAFISINRMLEGQT